MDSRWRSAVVTALVIAALIIAVDRWNSRHADSACSPPRFQQVAIDYGSPPGGEATPDAAVAAFLTGPIAREISGTQHHAASDFAVRDGADANAREAVSSDGRMKLDLEGGDGAWYVSGAAICR